MNVVLWNKPPVGRCKTGYIALSDLSQSEHWACVLSCYSVAKLCLCDPMDCSPAGSSVHEDSPGKNTGVGCHALLQEIFPTQGSNLGILHCRWILYHLSHQENLSGDWSSWIEFSQWCLLYFRSQMSPLNWISHPFLPGFVKVSISACPLPSKSLSAFLPTYPSYSRKYN